MSVVIDSDIAPSSRTTEAVLGNPIDVVSWPDAVKRISEWARFRESRVVCICNVHSVVTAANDAEFAMVLQAADMATPDGAPVAWYLRRLGHAGQERINGPDLMWRYCAHAETTGESIYLFGGMPETLEKLQARLRIAFPKLIIAGAWSPPFRAVTAEEEEAAINAINASRAGVVWVSLGCPKQEQWMHAQRGRVNAVMVGVGAAFDYHAGTIRRAPEWMQSAGLEWLHRLFSEPRRLWRRYFNTNTKFILSVAKEWANGRFKRIKKSRFSQE